jgi:hypothetical protein
MLSLRADVPNDENRLIRLVGQPITLSRTPSRMMARPPEFGVALPKSNASPSAVLLDEVDPLVS